MGVVMERWCPTQQMLGVFLKRRQFRRKQEGKIMEIKIEVKAPTISQYVALGCVGIGVGYTLISSGINSASLLACLIGGISGVILCLLVFGPGLRYPRVLAWIVFILMWNVIPAGLTLYNMTISNYIDGVSTLSPFASNGVYKRVC